MNIMFFPKIALNGIKNNKRLYYPFFVTCISVVGIYYILNAITYDDYLSSLAYVGSFQQITMLGCYVMAFFSVLFLLYTNSFLKKRRKNEFGLYNVLGMSKKNIAIVLFFESIYITLISLILGLFFGILFSKISELILYNLIKVEINYAFSINTYAISETLKLFIPVFIFLFITNVIGITKSKTVEMVNSLQEGEKEPKANWILGLLGVIILGIAYYLALSASNAVGALVVFFIAVILVIVATYLIFIASSVLVCKLLKNNKKYYYKTNHFISTSSLSFRMKRNGAGLASICILSTMVLVIISSTTGLYYGINDILEERYPKDFQIEFTYNQPEMIDSNIALDIDNKLLETINNKNKKPLNLSSYQVLSIYGYFKNNEFIYEPDSTSDYSLNVLNIVGINVIPVNDFNKLTGENVSLKDNEALLFKYNQNDLDELNIGDELHYDLLEPKEYGISNEFLLGKNSRGSVVDTLCIIVSNYDYLKESLFNMYKTFEFETYYEYNFDIDGSTEEKIALREDISKVITNDLTSTKCLLILKDVKIDDAYGLYGGLFFLGIMLSIVFIFATVLIIYYKQVTEGYEDQPKFQIMKKVGITDIEIRKTINTQMLTFFFMPLIMAILHMCFAFPMLRHLLMLLNLTKLRPLFVATSICILVYAIVYAIIFKITSNIYYSIVNNNLNEEQV